jgi:hypothetical protein
LYRYIEVFELKGIVLGMHLRYQMNFNVKPTDVYYPKLWQPAVGLSTLNQVDP